ncbi:hypothetical protein [Nitrosomonas aestuarii]|uniref:hypothetical protein n=1 Tax=Nitrosomonas aestuarii TaxID=52441 RepID=UPI000D311CF6|nr:hypothetical protein [Nitrosomonas aestuarii]
MFKLSSAGGALIDGLLDLKDNETRLGEKYFSLVNISNNPDEPLIALIDENKTNNLIIQADKVVFKKTSFGEVSAVSTDKAHQEFEILWKKADSILQFSAIRRIGIVGQFRFNETSENSGANDLIKNLIKLSPPTHSGRFHLTYENRQLNPDNSIPDKQTGDYWNTIYTYYLSENDETPENGKINANIDVQKYYNPAKSNLMSELKKVKEQFIKEKKVFRDSLRTMGFE